MKYICTLLMLITFLITNTAQVSNSETPEYLPDPSIKTCEGLLSAQMQLYNDMEIVVKTITNDASRTSPAAKEAYEKSVNLQTRSRVLQKTKTPLSDKGAIDRDCANKISEQELTWTAMLAELNGGKVDSEDLEKANKASAVLNDINACMKTCKEKNPSNQEAMINCIKECTEAIKKKMDD